MCPSAPRGRLSQSEWLIRGSSLLLLGIALLGFFFIARSPIPQSLRYHAFADHRTLLGVPNALNVLSNLPFVVIGLSGLSYLITG
jgi:hypothetical protein